jgi:hypothetical protein
MPVRVGYGRIWASAPAVPRIATSRRRGGDKRPVAWPRPGPHPPKILFDHGQGEIDARGHPSRGPHRLSMMKIRSSSTVTFGNRACKSRARCQCMVARRPSSKPASDSTNAPVQVEAIRRDRSRRAVFGSGLFGNTHLRELVARHIGQDTLLRQIAASRPSPPRTSLTSRCSPA